MSGYVVEMRIIDSRSRLRTFTIEDDGDVMKALMCNLGVFGIMYDVTLKVKWSEVHYDSNMRTKNILFSIKFFQGNILHRSHFVTTFQ